MLEKHRIREMHPAAATQLHLVPVVVQLRPQEAEALVDQSPPQSPETAAIAAIVIAIGTLPHQLNPHPGQQIVLRRIPTLLVLTCVLTPTFVVQVLPLQLADATW